MVKITQKDIAKLGRLARIGISDEVAQTLAPQLSAILDYDAKLQRIDTEDVAETDQVTGLHNVYREDVVRESPCSREALLQNAPQTEHGYIKVGRVL